MDSVFKIFNKYTVYQFFWTLFSSICLFCLINKSIVIWVGADYLLSNLIVVLLTADYWIHSMYQPQSCLYTAFGAFKDDKKIVLISAALNLTLSLILVNYIGLTGVVIGTLVSDIVTYFFRIYVVNVKIFKKGMGSKIAKDCLLFLLSIGIIILTFYITNKWFVYPNKYLDLLFSLLICIAISAIIILPVFLIWRKKCLKK